MMVISLGINPVRGGNPPKDRNKMIVDRCSNTLLEGILFICLVEKMLKYLSDENKGVIRMEYTIKYKIEALGLNMAKSLSIHPIWPIDEYAIIVRIWLWFIPMIPPTKALIPATAIINDMFFCGNKNAIIDRGASFCHVDRIRQEIHEIEDITDGYQKWQGTLPSFNRIAVVNIRGIILGREVNIIHKDVLDIRSKADPRAWARKYFTAPSVSWLFFVCIIIGINLRRLSSMAPHKRIQLVLESVIKVLISREISVSIIVGEWIKLMKIMEELNPLIRIRSSYLSRLI
jgi:hypothetical protein